MFIKNNQISERQAFRLLLFDLLGYGALLAPSALAETAGRDGIFSIAAGIGAGFLYLYVIKRLLAGGREDYTTCLTALCGRTGGALIKAGYYVYLLLLAGRVAATFAELIVNELLQKEFQLILLMILLLVYYGVSGGIEGRARVYEILFWLILVPLFLMMLSAVPAVDTDYWLPVLTEQPKQVLWGGYQIFTCMPVLFLLPFFTQYVRGKGQLYLCAKKALLWMGVILAALYLLLLGMFGDKALATLDYPAVTMMSRIQMSGGFLKRTDALMFSIWFFTLYALLNSLVFLVDKMWLCGGKCAKFRLPCEVIAIYILANVFYHSEEFEMAYEKFLNYIGTPFVAVLPVLLCFLMSGCSMATELENREFPTLLTVSAKEDFAGAWLNGLQEGTKKIDYNHLKVLLVEKSFLEKEKAMSEMLGLLKEDKNVPLNVYVLATDELEEIKETEADLEKTLGEYLEELLEGRDTTKKETYPTLGTLYQEMENRRETVFIPIIGLAEGKPAVTSYEVYRRGKAVRQVESDVALLSFFIHNQMKEYVLQLGVNNYVSLSDGQNEISFSESRENNGLLKKTVLVTVQCEGKILQQNAGYDKNEAEEWLTVQMKDYMTAIATDALESGIDVTNSFKRLGREREWYQEYNGTPDFFEEDIEIAFEINVAWTNEKWID